MLPTRFGVSLSGAMGPRRKLVLAAVGLAWFSICPAGAAPAPPPTPFVMGVRMEAGSQIKSDPGQIKIDCARLDRRMVCEIAGSWTLRNTGSVAVTAKGGLVTHEATEVKLSVDTIDWAPPVETMRALCERYSPDMLVDTDGCMRRFGEVFDHWSAPAWSAFEVSLAAGGTQRVDLACKVSPQNGRFTGFVIPGALVRHVEFGGFTGEARYRVNVYAGDAPVAIEVESRAPFRASGADRATGGTKPIGAGPLTVTDRLRIQLDGAAFFANGGPVLGLGTAHDLDPGFRARIGYQVYAPHWLQYELVIDTDFREQVVIATTAEWVSPMVVMIPSLGIGVGLPIQVAPTTRLGVRSQLSLMLGFLGFTASMDVFSGSAPLGERTRWTLLGQVSL